MSSTHNESRLAACPLSDVSGAHLRSLSTNTQASWKMCRLVWPSWTGLSTNASCQPEKPESSQVKTRDSASTPRVELAPHEGSLPTRENATAARTRGIFQIPATEAAAAPVNKICASSWGRSVVAPRHGFEPRLTAPKAAVLPLDDRGTRTAKNFAEFQSSKRFTTRNKRSRRALFYPIRCARQTSRENCWSRRPESPP
jgi:hypothetical protein